jgi:hypothetical protein
LPREHSSNPAIDAEVDFGTGDGEYAVQTMRNISLPVSRGHAIL